jgi:anti-sigma B factor antagonist
MADPRNPVVMTIGGVPVVDAPQEIDAANAQPFRKILLHTADRGHATVVVNMADTQFCDSAGMSAVAWAHGHITAKNAELLLVIPPGAPVLRLFALTGLDQIIPIFANLNAALEQARALLPRPLQRRTTPPQGRLAGLRREAVK